MRRTTRTAEDLRALAAVARGEAPADLYLAGGRVLNVYSGEVLEANVAVARGRVAYVGRRRTMVGEQTTVLDVTGRLLVPGYFDPHCHPGAMYTPVTLAEAVLPRGTVAAVADTLFPLVYADPARLEQVLQDLSRLPFHYYWFLRLHAQAPLPQEAERFAPDRLDRLLHLEPVRTAGEVTRWPLLHAGDPRLTELVAAVLAAGRRVEGHAPGVGWERLQALVAAGVSSDHEAITAEQALDRLRAGLYVMLRHSSLRGDLPALAGVASVARAFSGRLMLTPDGPDATFIADHGYMDAVIRQALLAGVDPVAAYQMATLNPATYYGLDEELGGIAPGRLADLNVLVDLRDPTPERVIAGGRLVAEEGRLTAPIEAPEWVSAFPRRYAPTWRPDPSLFAPPRGAAIALHLQNAVITRRRDLTLSDGPPPGVQVLTLLAPDGRWVARALLSGFADRLGGLACTYTVGGGMAVAGDDPHDMAAAARRTLELGGGVVAVEDGQVRFELPLPIGGLMSPEPLHRLAARVRELGAFLRARGYRHEDPTYTLFFLSFDSLPDLRLTALGIWDARAGRVLVPREER
ncbi:MAG: adenine deaminase C-terminal domain-containing protein [Armatimonadota bacterium]|nr:adenine deaminase C-terminal domain-containing protein [Armatimonadota bacterium]MDR7447995.1 adenine deaminase C-terminal domain-containing protein [Armatimonadota bacterium]MDR7458259.1 adenine deaminase C-terminal domain-containing protein [Armatimonadota bacterium]MDR7478437.1 adenine deaminase C-terminal domain-containing protein [Armatimonadota bacterium]MDR7487371.1 adenine deaminase C-terminal domain-containing protein [Armatimonadota bacterium]